MGVANPPPGRQDLAHVCFVIAVSILKEQKIWCMRNNDPAARKSQRSWDIEPIGKHGHLVALTVAIGILQNFNRVVALAVGGDLVRIVNRLRDPKPPPFVPGKADGVDDVRLAREQLQAKADRRLGVIHAVLRREWQLVGQWLRTVLVVGDVIALLVLQRRPASDELFIRLLSSIAHRP